MRGGFGIVTTMLVIVPAIVGFVITGTTGAGTGSGAVGGGGRTDAVIVTLANDGWVSL